MKRFFGLQEMVNRFGDYLLGVVRGFRPGAVLLPGQDQGSGVVEFCPVSRSRGFVRLTRRQLLARFDTSR
ncbi:hypothetical protein AB0F17_66185 [Nonomuraea sp. NPDC026600]|uniref:hypothetical protein n=1 Tax=Nonomuraea sp. NPDC026600 TaxID=3155363 RepID=UPI0033F0BBCD